MGLVARNAQPPIENINIGRISSSETAEETEYVQLADMAMNSCDHSTYRQYTFLILSIFSYTVATSSVTKHKNRRRLYFEKKVDPLDEAKQVVGGNIHFVLSCPWHQLYAFKENWQDHK